MKVQDDERQRVFRAYRPLFVGESALIRKKKAIIKRIESLKCPPDADLIMDLGQDKIVDILQSLLTDDAFTPKLIAKEPPSAILLRQQTTKGDNVKISVLSKSTEPSCDNRGLGKKGHSGDIDENVADKDLENSSSKDEVSIQDSSDDGSTNLSHAPFPIQHLVLTKIQTLLEQACFDFASKWATELISTEMWDCPEAIELSKWTLALNKVIHKIPINAFNAEDYPNIRSILHSGYEIRNIAVHRKRVSLQKLEDITQAAILFLRAIRDNNRELQLSNVHAVMSVFMWSLESRRQIIEARFREELGDIQRLRKALDLREKEADEAMRKANAKVNDLTRYMLEHSLREIFGGKV
ncbi:hypothetical protein TRV_02316 [Trichophyton verrucosum HKI 0517]|uniref:Ubiquinol-cytochrome-c reductase cytochrome c1 n=1 Tax=Trichophyton verrucosum (strain HKI 0517) TaxID=663202 RepID=D4D5E6_TRIVH|nr:uncharacterized protein TRV_02316 [Trichophyton verrucosum HKI 0517]EFE42951.1 hypothetical protein TRV_02316 [Trichophyton verrucosum HKI 0517]